MKVITKPAKSFTLILPFLCSLSQVHFFNSFFYDKLRTKGYDGVKRWTKNVSVVREVKFVLIYINIEPSCHLKTQSGTTKAEE